MARAVFLGIGPPPHARGHPHDPNQPDPPRLHESPERDNYLPARRDEANQTLTTVTRFARERCRAGNKKKEKRKKKKKTVVGMCLCSVVSDHCLQLQKQQVCATMPRVGHLVVFMFSGVQKTQSLLKVLERVSSLLGMERSSRKQNGCVYHMCTYMCIYVYIYIERAGVSVRKL